MDINTSTIQQDYLSKPEIPNVVYTVEKTQIRIANDNTVFCQAIRTSNPISKTEFLAMYKYIVSIAKQNKISVSYKNKYKSKVIDNYDLYLQEFNNADNLFNQMYKQALIVKERKLHYGCIDDAELNKLHDISNKYMACFYRNTLLSQVTEINSHIKQLYNDFKQIEQTGHLITGCIYTKIYL
jgi:hypothetical protein